MDMRSSNPALPANTFTSMRWTADRADAMTIQGTAFKTVLLLLLTMLSAGWTWMKFYQAGGDGAVVAPWMMGGVIGGLVLALVTVFKKEWSPITAPLYALFEGFFIGGISAQLQTAFPGIVIQAAGLTFGTMFAMLLAYQSGLIKATEKFKLGVVAATGGIALVYFVAFILSFFGIQASFLYSSSWLSIGISLFVIVVAALNFIIDFDFIEQGARQNVPKYMEWYGAFCDDGYAHLALYRILAPALQAPRQITARQKAEGKRQKAKGKRQKADNSMRDLSTRTQAFALRIIRLYAALPKTYEAQVIGKQLLRSGTSVGAQYRESMRARSPAEFVAKIHVGLQELRSLFIGWSCLCLLIFIQRHSLQRLSKKPKN